MKRIAFSFLIAMMFLSVALTAEAIVIVPTKEMRQKNYGPSCLHAAMITMLRWQGLNAQAKWWRHSFRGGESHQAASKKLELAKIRYKATYKSNINVLEYASDRKLGAVIDWGENGGHHAVFFCGFNGRFAAMINPNTNKLHTYDKARFVAYWKQCGGRALVTLYSRKGE